MAAQPQAQHQPPCPPHFGKGAGLLPMHHAEQLGEPEAAAERGHARVAAGRRHGRLAAGAALESRVLRPLMLAGDCSKPPPGSPAGQRCIPRRHKCRLEVGVEAHGCRRAHAALGGRGEAAAKQAVQRRPPLLRARGLVAPPAALALLAAAQGFVGWGEGAPPPWDG